jgi:hypothetical protein
MYPAKLWDQVAAIAACKYESGDGLPVEISPFTTGPVGASGC